MLQLSSQRLGGRGSESAPPDQPGAGSGSSNKDGASGSSPLAALHAQSVTKGQALEERGERVRRVFVDPPFLVWDAVWAGAVTHSGSNWTYRRIQSQRPDQREGRPLQEWTSHPTRGRAARQESRFQPAQSHEMGDIQAAQSRVESRNGGHSGQESRFQPVQSRAELKLGEKPREPERNRFCQFGWK